MEPPANLFKESVTIDAEVSKSLG